ncbi:MAG: beta-N-acetylhexosaminidase [Nitrospirae bacterium]|nr:MAG: beta-N-acetylhexosaminidase [Nitrospirota bacterium]
MAIRDLVSSLFLVGFQGTDVSPQLANWLETYRPAGFIVFSRNLENPDQIARLTASLQTYADEHPFLIAIDQEGGRVSRLPPSFTIFPSAASLGACQDPDLAYEAAATTAKELLAVGINMNMAPVLDVNTNPANPIIGDRAFGHHPDLVKAMGVATMTGLQDHGVIACGKHFPGHGETTADSHVELPTVTTSRARLDSVELSPFRDAIDRGIAALMTAHVRYMALDAERPATLSPSIVTGLLRETLGFTGVIVTDDLEMQGVLDCLLIEEASVLALNAGCDMLVICHDPARQSRAIEAVVRAVEEGRLSIDRIMASHARITALKQRFHLSRSAPPEGITQIVGSSAHRALCEKIRHLSASLIAQETTDARHETR